jgi:hypothetical protein
MQKYLLLTLMTVTALPVMAWPGFGRAGASQVSGTHPRPTSEQMAARHTEMQQRMDARRAAMQPCSAALHAAKNAADMVAARKTCRDISKTLSKQDAAARNR